MPAPFFFAPARVSPNSDLVEQACSFSNATSCKNERKIEITETWLGTERQKRSFHYFISFFVYWNLEPPNFDAGIKWE